MNFNGRFWNKPGHLGMTTDEVKKALQALPTPEAGDAGKAVVVNADGDGYELGEAGGGSLYQHNIKVTSATEAAAVGTVVSIINNIATPFTEDTLTAWLAEQEITLSKTLPVSSGAGKANSYANRLYIRNYLGLYATGTHRIRIGLNGFNFSINEGAISISSIDADATITAMSDNVIEL
jgi:hypothetical protein